MSRWYRVTARTVASVSVGAVLLASGAPAQAAGRGWELDAMSVSSAHAISRGEGVTVAVIDSGIRTNHQVLDGRATEGPDFLGETDQKEPWYGRHGTMMASNVLDVAPGAKVLGLRAIRDNEDPDYRTWEQGLHEPPSKNDAGAIANAIRHATDNGARVISLSLGSDTPFSAYDPGEMDAVQYALAKGVVVIASAGNEGNKGNQVSYPVSYPGVIGVAASIPGGGRAPFSSVHSYVDVAAPGVQIWGAKFNGTGRVSGQGTSQAGALTAGVAALIVAKYPKLAPRQVAELLQATASHPNRHDPSTGYGVINAAKALRAAEKVAPQPLTLVGAENAGGHFGPGNDGTPRLVGQPLAVSYLVAAGVLALVALAMTLGGFLMALSGRRARRRTQSSVPATI
ncbi:S8 family serine peptidase [Micromonospora sp. DT201]|uniref:S8 family serine peptidase n=1 Tax=Micromonospora sp. DT201 TaxID=3393442 RepID=UPI003CEBCE7E